MVQFNFSERTIKAKVVYYGPAQSGKTTNLEQIHRISDPAGTNRLISLNTAHDRTLFFDLLPFSLGAVAGYDFKIQLYTVPGQVQYNATRRVVLAGADAVVFVADSGRNILAENQAAFDNMKVNLLANRLAPEKVPLIIQYNKRDLPDVCSEEELNRSLNPWGRRTFTAVAAQGRGVMETFVAVIQEMLASIASKYNLKEKGLDPATVGDVVTEAFAPILKRAAATPPAAQPPPDGPARVVVSQMTETLSAPAGPAVAAADAGLISEELLHRSIRSNVELAEALAGLVRDMNLGLGSILSHAELLLMYREDAREKRAAAISSIQQEAARLRRIVQGLGRAGASAAETPLPHHASSASIPAIAPPPKPAAPAPPPPTIPLPRMVPPPPAAARAAPVAAAVPARPASGPDTAPDAPPPPSRADLAAVMRDVMRGLGQTFDSLGIGVDVRISPGILLPPSCSGPEARRALTRLVEGLVTGIDPASDLSLRCERKTVLLRTREGEVRKDFLMLGLAHAGNLPAEDQQRIVHGSDTGPLGQAARLVRALGGFVRFAPLPSGGLETRVFLPAA